MLEHNKRLMAALAAKPIEGVENWGIPDEPDTPCDAERQVRFFSLSLIVSVCHLCHVQTGTYITFPILESIWTSIERPFTAQ